jgi:hypothetical protein
MLELTPDFDEFFGSLIGNGVEFLRGRYPEIT